MAVQDYKSLKLVIYVQSSSEPKTQIGFLINDFHLSFMIKKKLHGYLFYRDLSLN